MARIRHLAIISEDREKLAEFYTKAFGMKRIESTGPAIYLTDGYINLALIQKRPHNKQGLYHFGFVVDDIEALRPLCKQLGAVSDLETDPTRRRAGCTTPTEMPSMFLSGDGRWNKKKENIMKLKVFAALLVLVICTGKTEGADRVRIGVSNYNLSNLTVGVAHTRDFFKQENIEAEIIRMNPNVATMALVSGDVDYSTLIGSIIGANLKGAKLKMIACSQDRTPLALVGKPEFKSVENLKGRTIGVGSYGSTPDIVARMVVKHFGIDPDKEIKVLALGSDGARLAALKEGVVDVIIVAPPVDFEGQKMGFHILSRAGDIFRFPYNGLGTSVKKLSEKPDEVKRVLRALIKANEFIRKDREGTVQVLIHWAKTKPEFAAAAYDSAVGVFSPDGSIPEDGLRIVIENFRKSMNITRQIPLNEVSDSTPLREAQRELAMKR